MQKALGLFMYALLKKHRWTQKKTC